MNVNLVMWAARDVRCGPMTPGEARLALMFNHVSRHPLEELYVTADPEQAVIYFWSERAGLHVACGFGTQHKGPITVRPHVTEVWS